MNDLPAENSFADNLSAFDLTKFSEPQSPAAVGEKFLVFSIGDELFAVSSNQIAEATASLAVTALPNSPEWLLGLANLRGEIVSVVDLPKALRRRNSAAAPKSKFIVLHSKVFEGGAAFKADKINEIAAIAGDAIRRVEDEKSPHVFGQTFYKSQTLNFIDTEKLLASLRK